ncbi:restriction endonuclease subunit S [Myroides sp.]|uniref:restriction endonuclease subunit S n=1 Tax=Myroides sp. TaxID=1874736 RepID=UPI003F2B7069
MSKVKKYKFSDLYMMSSGISSKPEQAGHGSPFVSFKTVFNNYFLPEVLVEKMNTSEKEQVVYSIKKGDIFLTRTSESLDELGMSSVAYKDYESATFSGFLKRLRPLQNDVTYYKYMSFYLRSKLFRETMNNNAIMTLRASLNEQIFSYLDLILPSFEIQKTIGDLFFNIFSKIELNNKINTELEQMAKTLYDYWFVQFDFPNEEGKPYKSSGGKMVYNDVLKREIPEGWEVTVFNNWIKQTKTGDWGKEQVEGNYTERVYCVRGADINGLNGKGGVKAPERFILKNNLSKVLESNDFIIEISGGSPTQSTARIALLTKETFDRFDTDVVCSNFCKAVTLENESYVYNFQQEWQRLYDAGVFFGFEGKTSGIKNFLFESFMDSYDIVKPSEELVLKYNAIAKEVEKKKQLNLKQNKELADLRDWLLPMLMNGQVSVGDVVDQEANIVKGDRRIRDLFGDEEYLRRKALAVYIVNQSLGDKSFGKTKFMKLLHLVEYHIVQGSLEQAYYKHAAGPYDGAFATKFWNEVIEDKWYRIEELGSLNHIVSGVNHNDTKDYTSFIEDNLREQIKAFIHIFKDCNYEQPEVVSTLYAVWNNRIIQKELITDALLKQDFLAWDKQKEKYVDILDKALGWMRSNKIVPTGWGKVIKASKSRRGEI